MSSSTNVGAVGQQGAQASNNYDAWNDLDLHEFIGLLVAELQNQDPLDPMSNQEILQQIGQIREIESSQHLTETLQSVLMGQNISTAGNLIERTIVGLSDDGQRVSGKVERVSIKDGIGKLHVGDHAVSLENVAEILPDGAEVGFGGET